MALFDELTFEASEDTWGFLGRLGKSLIELWSTINQAAHKGNKYDVDLGNFIAITRPCVIDCETDIESITVQTALLSRLDAAGENLD